MAEPPQRLLAASRGSLDRSQVELCPLERLRVGTPRHGPLSRDRSVRGAQRCAGFRPTAPDSAPPPLTQKVFPEFFRDSSSPLSSTFNVLEDAGFAFLSTFSLRPNAMAMRSDLARLERICLYVPVLVSRHYFISALPRSTGTPRVSLFPASRCGCRDGCGRWSGWRELRRRFGSRRRVETPSGRL